MSRFNLPVTIVAGYLGSGKTSYINERLKQAGGLRYAVLVNDFGELNIDAELIESTTAKKISLTNGCVCCSIANDVSEVMEEIDAMADSIDWVLFEASGVADPERLQSIVMNQPGFNLQDLITLIDVSRIRMLAKDKYVGQHIIKQIVTAKNIVLSKVDLVSPEALQEIEIWLQKQILSTTKVELPQFFTHTVSSKQLVTFSQLESWIKTLPATVVRVKGFVSLRDQRGNRMLVQCVEKEWRLDVSGQWDGTNRLVLISTTPLLSAELELC